MGVNWSLMPLAGERQGEILQAVRANGSVRVRLLAERLGVSEMTIRRDIEVLAAAGLVEKIHGGARVPGRAAELEPRFEAKRQRQGAEKTAIARAAAEMVQPGAAIGISAGTTTHAFAGLLRGIPGLTIVTNSIPVADKLARGGGKDPGPATVLLTGGESTPSRALVGPIAVSALRKLHVSTLFLGVHGFGERGGLSAPSLFEAEVDQTFIASAERVVVLADHTKWNTIGMTSIAPLSAIDVLVTDAGLDPAAQQVLREHVGTLIIAEAQSDGRKGA